MRGVLNIRTHTSVLQQEERECAVLHLDCRHVSKHQNLVFLFWMLTKKEVYTRLQCKDNSFHCLSLAFLGASRMSKATFTLVTDKDPATDRNWQSRSHSQQPMFRLASATCPPPHWNVSRLMLFTCVCATINKRHCILMSWLCSDCWLFQQALWSQLQELQNEQWTNDLKGSLFHQSSHHFAHVVVMWSFGHVSSVTHKCECRLQQTGFAVRGTAKRCSATFLLAKKRVGFIR